MPCLDTLYKQTITLFNRVPGGVDEPSVWVPTVIPGVHLVISKSSDWSGSAGGSSGDVKLNIRYRRSGNDILIRCLTTPQGSSAYYKRWYERKQWRRLPDKRNALTFSYGDNDGFDFFVEGVFTEFASPISDLDFGRSGFYNHVNAEYDNVFAINSVSRFDVIPHFEITAK